MTKHIKKVSGLSRREVLVGSAAGAGLVIGYSVLPNAVDSASKAIAAGNWDHQQFLSMDADGKATVHVTKCEIGQHVGTALAQAVAEELEIDWNDVRVIIQSLMLNGVCILLEDHGQLTGLSTEILE